MNAAAVLLREGLPAKNHIKLGWIIITTIIRRGRCFQRRVEELNEGEYPFISNIF